MTSKYLIIAILSFFSMGSEGQQLAFPGAEGFGRYATGGRNGTVYHVTNLADSGPGSFRDAVSQPNRIVVFDVGGVIRISSRVVISRNITIAGQTAPGDGITIYGNGIAFNGDSGNDIIRYIRFRMGKYGDEGKDAVGISEKSNYMFDHVSISWGWDGTFDINGSGIDNISIQDCMISQGIDKDGHSTGGLMQSGRFSIIRTLWIDNNTRNPKSKGQHEFINSVIYNWGEHGWVMGGTTGVSEVNILGSYLIAGPSSNVGEYFNRTTPTFYIYEEDNWLDGNKDGTLNGSQLLASEGAYKTATLVDNPFAFPGVNTVLSAQDAVNYVMENAGASIVRDEVDQFLVNELKSYGTLGQIIITEDDNGISGGVGTVNNGPKPEDADNDGMPDEWEDANGTNKAVDDAMVISDNGYANIENYINSIQSPLLYLQSPYELSASHVTATGLTLNWASDEEVVDEFIVEYGTSETDFDHQLTVPGDSGSIEITGLETALTYYFRIQAVNEETVSAFSPVLAVTTDVAAIAPRACVSPSPADGSLIGFVEGVKLGWENTTPLLAGELTYDIFLGLSEQFMERIGTTTQPARMAGDLQAGRTYYWRVKTSNPLGTNEGDIWSFTVGTAVRNKVLDIPFDDSTGMEAINFSSDNNAMARNMVPSWEQGKSGTAVYFSAAAADGAMVVDHYVGLSMDISPFTISLWYKAVPDNNGNAYLLHKGTHNASQGETGTGKWFGIQYVAGERLTFAIDDNASKTSLDLTNPDQYFDGEWHHLACVRDVASDRLQVYRDGSLLHEVVDQTGNISEAAELVLGNSNYSFDAPFEGYLDELIIFDDALSSDEVAYLYTSQSTGQNVVTGLPLTILPYPNPFESELHFTLPYKGTRDLQVCIYDLNGRLVFDRRMEKHGARLRLRGLEAIAPGCYTCMIIGGPEVFYCKVIRK